MILNDKEIKDGNWSLRYDYKLEISHLEANIRIKELEGNLEKARTTAQYWKNCHLAGNTKIRELEMQLENCRLDAAGVAAYIQDAKAAEDRADQLAVVADALAVECGRLTALIDVLSDNSRRDTGMFVTAQSDAWEQESIATHAKAKLQELVKAAKERDRFISLEEPGLPDSKERNDFCDAKFRAWERYQAALEAAKDEQ